MLAESFMSISSADTYNPLMKDPDAINEVGPIAPSYSRIRPCYTIDTSFASGSSSIVDLLLESLAKLVSMDRVA